MKNVTLRNFRKIPADRRRLAYVGHIKRNDGTVDVYEIGEEETYRVAVQNKLENHYDEDEDVIEIPPVETVEDQTVTKVEDEDGHVMILDEKSGDVIPVNQDDNFFVSLPLSELAQSLVSGEKTKFKVSELTEVVKEILELLPKLR